MTYSTQGSTETALIKGYNYLLYSSRSIMTYSTQGSTETAFVKVHNNLLYSGQHRHRTRQGL